MKKMKKYFALFVALAMVMIYAVPMSVFAEGEDTVSITVNRDSTYAGEATANSRNFTWYKVFSASYGDDFEGNNEGGGYTSTGGPGTVTGDTTNPVAYTASVAVAGKLGTIDATTKAWTTNTGNQWFDLTYVPGTGLYNVSWRKNVNENADTAQAAAKWLVENGVYETTGPLTFSDGKWSAEVEKGYYVLSSEAGKNLIAATTNINVDEKNDYPPLDKTQADEDNATQSNNDSAVAIGDVLTYEVKVTIPKTAQDGDKIVVWDKPSSGLTYNNDVKVKSNTASATVNPGTDGSNYTGTGYVSDASWNQLITITNETIRGADVVFTFTMTVNNTALVDTDKKNESGLKYGRGSGEIPFPYESKPDVVKYKTYFGGIEKQDGTNNTVKLDNVKFTLTENDTPFNVTAVMGTGDNADKVLYYIPGGTSNEVVTDGQGLVKIRGLDNNKVYKLTETENPHEGYNMLTEPVTLTLTEDTTTTITYTVATQFASGTTYYTKDGDNYVEASGLTEFEEGVTYYTKSESSTSAFDGTTVDTWQNVDNNKGTILPSTGGIGTTIFYILGTILVLAAGVLLVTRRRMRHSEE